MAVSGGRFEDDAAHHLFCGYPRTCAGISGGHRPFQRGAGRNQEAAAHEGKGVWLWKLAGYYLFKLVDLICQVYLTVIRGTPTMIQLLIMYYVIFGSVNIDKRIVAILAFGINSGAYVAEIVRSGIMAIDIGQFEAGRSLGLGYPATMWHIILPQAFKNVLPALGNEIIVLLKETSISGYIALTDLTHGGNVIRSQTYSAFMPLIAVALIYLAIVSLLAAGVSRLERRLRTSER